MIVYIKLDAPKIEKSRKGVEDKRHDPVPETIADIKATGLRLKKPGIMFKDHFILRGETQDEEVIGKIRKVAFVMTAKKVS